ncbi:CST complex subunit STN1 isoform X1 [Monodelphis domestica]|uniref:CST complex subunit STN1 n=1 Tax=Monodelphis domestica TaxID=13616 RepID=F7A106_MONDO|nr:CST complex subunit STN1 isoform X1 [Monodelphis domestica]XP_056660404.1 CST complex subunit STN1 isoform X1 [Monodelphis domestica]XP_056660406.1 CST complex subunit STN1 isoform X1 [Monodelphis domestica]XP_056660411.1 CST complex subunit STN1 isoform X1 [Monodelphis domestica]XP_056660417.1 CST complex subunit STN1 isoform X1 [Monodelphis domestica]
MQPESRECEEETPSLLWGLDPVFLAFAKLYVKDILNIKESQQAPGVFFYNGHPIKQVDILGTVVGVKEKESFYSYGVDDSTGVINCICWKNSQDTKPFPAKFSSSVSGGQSLTSLLRKLQETTEKKTKLEIGDIIRMRGYIRVYREQREIHATTYYKVDDPVWNVQIARMLELPDIYRKVYDQPFPKNTVVKGKTVSNPGTLDPSSQTSLLSEKIQDFLVENKVQTFYQQELEAVESLMALVTQPVVDSSCSEQVNLESGPTSKAIHNIFKEAIRQLWKKGIVFQKTDDLYCVTSQDKELHKKILRIIQDDCQKPKHSEKGCHFLHILACARLHHDSSMSEAVLQQVLDLLEDKSEIVSTMERYYTAF